MKVDGEVASGFERVRKAFEEGAGDLGAGGGAFAAYVGDEKVVDLWGGSSGAGRPWERDTRAVLMSATKGLVALCAHILHDRGTLGIDARVAEYWPEFAQAGKQDITVRHVLTHSAGVLGFPGRERDLAWDGTGWADQDAIARRLAEAAPVWEPGTKQGYHALSFGWLVAELIRRIDGRTLGAFFREEVAIPLGLDARIGTPPDEQTGVATVLQGTREERANELELILGALPEEIAAPVREVMVGVHDGTTPPGIAFLARDDDNLLDNLATLMNSPAALAAEIGGGNGTASARSLARVYAMLACGGAIDGTRIVSEASLPVFTTAGEAATDQVLGLPSSWGLGYAGNWGLPGTPRRFGPSERAFGHAGAGGQVGYCDPDRRVAVGFVRSQLTMVPVFFTLLRETLYECLD